MLGQKRSQGQISRSWPLESLSTKRRPGCFLMGADTPSIGLALHGLGGVAGGGPCLKSLFAPNGQAGVARTMTEQICNFVSH
jgi:hypothetical protein